MPKKGERHNHAEVRNSSSMRSNSLNSYWSPETAQRAIIVSGCLGMAYTQLTMSPATIAYAQSLGATGLHIGILGALPVAMLFMQFLAAIAANHLRYRRRTWVSVSVLQRLILVPVVCGPLLFPEVSDAVWIWGFVLSTAANHAMLHFCTPLWLSWMGDYLPHQGLNRYWGIRHRWAQWAGAASLLGGAVFVWFSGWSIVWAFALLVITGAVFGIADVLTFLKIDEPPIHHMPEPRLWKTLSAPFRVRQFRSFIGYSCFWHFAAMTGAPFISMYLLSVVGMDLFQLLMLWTCSWVGGALLARRFGSLAETSGNRPVLILCTLFKPLNMIALLLVPHEPSVAFWLLVPVFMVDALLNAGIAIATNGFLLKNSPSQNRTTFIAAGTAVSGLVGGAASIMAGAVLAALDGWSIDLGGFTANGFHLLFATSLLLRIVAVFVARRIHEPQSHGTAIVITDLLGVTPLRMLRLPMAIFQAGQLNHAPQPKPPARRPLRRPVIVAEEAA
mgnify:FL=1